jgi:NAD(P)-dependent dehydrogenase (short-subunit alcohol dehydrogenase family)
VNHLAKTLANEERSIVTVAIRPGMVDTAMQEIIRGDMSKNMNTDEADKFKTAHRDGKLLPPEKPGHVMARLATNATKDLSGAFLTWSDDKLAAYQDK